MKIPFCVTALNEKIPAANLGFVRSRSFYCHPAGGYSYHQYYRLKITGTPRERRMTSQEGATESSPGLNKPFGQTEGSSDYYIWVQNGFSAQSGVSGAPKCAGHFGSRFPSLSVFGREHTGNKSAETPCGLQGTGGFRFFLLFEERATATLNFLTTTPSSGDTGQRRVRRCPQLMARTAPDPSGRAGGPCSPAPCAQPSPGRRTASHVLVPRPNLRSLAPFLLLPLP